MADVTGPISSLPGTSHKVPAGTMCDEHPEREAWFRIQGETDSMGSEMHDMCAECHDAWKLRPKDDHLGFCDSRGCDSKGKQVPLFPWRDYDEGMSGPVYYNCAACKSRILTAMNEAAALELAESRGYDDYDPVETGIDDFDEESPRPTKWFVKYTDTGRPLLDRTGYHWLTLPRREAEKFVKRHKGKLRGRRIYACLY